MPMLSNNAREAPFALTSHADQGTTRTKELFSIFYCESHKFRHHESTASRKVYGGRAICPAKMDY